jgi:hypothetical protein
MSELKYALLYGLTESEKAQVIDYLENKEQRTVEQRLELIEKVLKHMNETLTQLYKVLELPDTEEKIKNNN